MNMSKKKSIGKNPRVYADENLPQSSLDFLKSKKINLIQGIIGRDDIFHHNQAVQKERVLLTLDKDFLDSRRFSFRKSWGIIVLKPIPPVSSDRVASLIKKLLPIIKANNRNYFKMKKIVATEEKLSIWKANRSGKISKEILNW